ncbi:nucleotide-binding protein [Curtobacterium sp. APC 4022]|uniref:nucleotide-binding protein n=1 Tax=Curtobacterium sp. APC 4022 TaxID=3035201 RepID=UPI0025B3BE15|nr:nucleotide-binding protein [Curtobacterium sp. APC 4022]MDN3478300.1 nucleotide-binding protein [Curtobacterium sp. APC 4022]
MTNPLVFDTGPLRHFAMHQWLGSLKFLTGDRGLLIPESVEYELLRQERELPALRQILEADWVEVDRSDDLDFTAVFADYEERLVPLGTKDNFGECGVLALGKARGFEVVLDDGTPRGIAEAEKIRVTATLPLLCEGIRAGQLTVPMVEHLADELIAGDYYLPFGPGEFRRWALEEGLIEYGD